MGSFVRLHIFFMAGAACLSVRCLQCFFAGERSTDVFASRHYPKWEKKDCSRQMPVRNRFCSACDTLVFFGRLARLCMGVPNVFRVFDASLCPYGFRHIPFTVFSGLVFCALYRDAHIRNACLYTALLRYFFLIFQRSLSFSFKRSYCSGLQWGSYCNSKSVSSMLESV